MPANSSAFVYFLHAPSLNLVKIGYAKRWALHRRVAAIEAISPVELIPLGVVRTFSKSERYYHKKFDWLRERGEWFRAERSLMDYVQFMAEPWPDPTEAVVAEEVAIAKPSRVPPPKPGKSGRRPHAANPIKRAERLRIVEHVLIDGYSVAAASRRYGVSAATVYRYIQEVPSYPEGRHLRNLVGLED